MTNPVRHVALRSVLALLVLGLLSTPAAFAQHAQHDASPAAGDLTPEQWEADLDHLVEVLLTYHDRPFHSISEDDFNTAVADLRSRLPELTDQQITVEIARLLASVRDGHTSVWLIPGFQGIHNLPIRLYDYEDGLFVQAVHESFAWAVGAEVLRIGDTEAAAAMTRVGDIVSRDNPIWIRAMGVLRLNMPEVLQALGIVGDVAPIVYTLRTTTGETRELRFTEDDFLTRTQGLHDRGAPLPESWVGISDTSENPVPLYRQRNDENYWFTVLEDPKAIYVQYNVVGDAHDEPIADFSSRLTEAIETEAPERLILDVRGNGGGDSFLNTPLVTALIKADGIDQRGHLFTIIGRGTFSAAQHLVTDLERWTNTIFVGEPTGSSPNHYGDGHRFVLPNSGARGSVSLVYWLRTYRSDPRPWVAPFLVAPLHSTDARDNLDPALDAALTYDPSQPRVSDRLIDAHQSGGLDAAKGLLAEVALEPLSRYFNTEASVNRLGYVLLGDGRVQDAIAVFAWNVENHPDSFNAYDSLGEAYLEAEDWPAARANYARSLELNPRNGHAARVIAEMDAHAGGSD